MKTLVYVVMTFEERPPLLHNLDSILIAEWANQSKNAMFQRLYRQSSPGNSMNEEKHHSGWNVVIINCELTH